MSWEMMNEKEFARFQSYSQKEKDCIVWIGHKLKNGYGIFFLRGKQYYAHRISYFQHKGLIPKGLEIDHLCRNRACVNPNHLEAVTRSENTKRGLAPGMINNFHKRKTHCRNGHPYSEENTYRYKNKRDCRICQRVRNYKYKNKQNGK